MRIASITGLVAQVVFVLAWLVAAAWQGVRYSVLAHSISDMYAVTAPGGIVLVVVFTLTGAATIAFAWAGLWPALRGAGWPALVGTVLLTLSIFGLGDLLSPFERLACRLADPGCTAAGQLGNAGGRLDSTLSTLGVIAFIAAIFFLAAAMAKVPDWRRLSGPTIVIGILTVLAFVALGALGGSGLGGLFERLLALFGAVGIAVFAAWTLRLAPR
jgi:hypothetical protein